MQHVLYIPQVFIILRDDKVKFLSVSFSQLSREVSAIFISGVSQSRKHARIRPAPHVVGGGATGVHFYSLCQPGIQKGRPAYNFCCRAAADVAQTDKENANFGGVQHTGENALTDYNLSGMKGVPHILAQRHEDCTSE